VTQTLKCTKCGLLVLSAGHMSFKEYQKLSKTFKCPLCMEVEKL